MVMAGRVCKSKGFLKMKGVMERRTGSWFERDNGASASNNGDSRMAAVV